jgi:ribosomal protein S18 acetylase RimI-like enzyme
MTITIQHGLPAHLLADAAALYWQAFGGKLGHVMGPPDKALRFLARVIRRDHAFVALDGSGALIGMAGYKTPAGNFAGGGPDDLRVIYGALGMAWRMPLLWALGHEADNDRFLLDGICVVAAARGQGIGSALMESVCSEGAARGYAHIRLDVIESNWRAKALYERLGFAVEKTDDIGLLRLAFGFRRSHTMIKAL